MHLRLGNPLLYSTHPRHRHGHGHGCSSAPLCDLTSYRCQRPSSCAGAWVDQHQGGGGSTLHTRHARSLCTAAASVYICFASHRLVIGRVCLSLLRFPLHQQSASSRHKKLREHFLISFCQGAPSHSLYLPPPITLYPYPSCTEYISTIFTLWYHCHYLLFAQVETLFDIYTT